MNTMGRHKFGQVPIGAYVNKELRDYLDQLAAERGFSGRSDAVRVVICEHKAVFSKRIDGTQALTPEGVAVNGNHITEVKNE